MVWSLIS